MSDTHDKLMNALKQVAASNQGWLEKKVAARLDERERRLLDWLMEQYRDEANRRWYDPFHILYSTNFALELINTADIDRLMVSGIILHDIGYFAIPDKSWSNPHSRITHMQEGTALAARVLSENGYSASELEIILGMIAGHDNPYLGIDITDKDRLALRDCDRIWVMHPLSFYKDLLSKPERYADPRTFLHDRLIHFFGWDQPFGAEWAVTIEAIKKNAKRLEPPTFELTRQTVQQQFSRRIREFEQDILQKPEQFEARLAEQISTE